MRLSRNRPSPPTRRSIGLFALLAAAALPACGSGNEKIEQAGAGPEAGAPPAPSGPSPSSDQASSAGLPILIRIGNAEITGRLDDTPTAQDLAAQLPLTLTFRDHNGVEKTAPLPSELSLEGAPDAHDPVAGDIGYWAPDADLVFYYDSNAPSFSGIVRIGEVESGIEAIEDQGDDFRATVELASE